MSDHKMLAHNEIPPQILRVFGPIYNSFLACDTHAEREAWFSGVVSALATCAATLAPDDADRLVEGVRVAIQGNRVLMVKQGGRPMEDGSIDPPDNFYSEVDIDP